MNDQVTIKCKHCSKNFEWNKLKLAPLWGKTVKLKCKHCKQYNQVVINADLMSGKKNSAVADLVTDPVTEYSIHAKQNIKSLQLAKLHVIENEYTRTQSFVLKEGDYIIGRQSDDDASMSNKIRIVTEDIKMSRSHCQLSVVQKADQSYRYILTDLGSLNGTHLETAMGNKKLEKNERIVVQLGDVVGLGYRTQIKLE
jgi:hypothetical protein